MSAYEADQLTVNEVDLKPIEKTIEHGKAILKIQIGSDGEGDSEGNCRQIALSEKPL